MRHTLLLSLMFLVSANVLLAAQESAPTGETDSLPWFKTSFLDIADDVAEASEAGKQVILYFHQDGCPYCAKLLRDNFGQREIAARTQDQFDVVSLNLWGDRDVVGLDGEITTEKEFGRSLQVMFTPTLLLLDGEGQVALRINGYYPPHFFVAALDFVHGGHQREMGFREYVAQREPQSASGILHSEQTFLQPPLRLQAARPADAKPLLVFFEQQQCWACDELHGEALKLPETRELLKQFRSAIVDIWSRDPLLTPDGRVMTAMEWAAELEISYAPSLVFFAPDGGEIFRSEAYLRPFHIQSVLDYVGSGAWRDWPEFQRYVQSRADQMREAGEEVEIW